MAPRAVAAAAAADAAAPAATAPAATVRRINLHEWLPSDNGANWRRRNTCRPFKPIGQRELYCATYRKCYDVDEHSFTHCCINKCSRKVRSINRRHVEPSRFGRIVIEEKCNFCFAREHSTNCNTYTACRCACRAYQYDMMWTPIGEGTFEYKSTCNRMMSFVDWTNGCLIMPRDIVDILVKMGFATVGAQSSLFLSPKATCSMPLPPPLTEEQEEEEEDPVVLFTTAAMEKYANVMIRCCACLYTISLKSINDWKKLNFAHGAYCPPCAFVRQPISNNASIVTIFEHLYRIKFAKLHALFYSECAACPCQNIVPSTYQ